MVQQTAIEIVAVPLPFYDAFNGLSHVLFYTGGLGIQLASLFNNNDLLPESRRFSGRSARS